MSPQQSSAVLHQYEDLVQTSHLSCPPDVPLGRGLGQLNNTFDFIHDSDANYSKHGTVDFEHLVPKALYVTADRVSTPRVAGNVDPALILRGGRRDAYHRQAIELTPCDTETMPRPCHMVHKNDEHGLNL